MSWNLSAIITIILFVCNIILSVMSWLMKRTVGTALDDVRKLDETKASRPELTVVREDLQKQIAKNSSDIETIKADFLTKEDFYRVQARTENRLDEIVNILLEMKGELGKHGNG